MALSISACSELELGSHFAKSLTFPSDNEEQTGSFKVGNPYKIKGKTYEPYEKYQYSETGIASWYGPGFHGKMTANGEIFNKHELTAAHRTLQMPSIVRVTNLENGRSIIVRVNDRGPFSDDRIIDLSEKAASVLNMKKNGTARVRVDVMEKESRQVAQAARDGLSTRGTEIVLNRGKSLDSRMPLQIAKPMSKPTVGQSRLASATQKNQQGMFKGLLISQANAADIPRKPILNPTHDYFVHAGSFKTMDDAMTMKISLSSNMADPITINNNISFYDVKIGPVRSEFEADKIVQSLRNRNRDASIVIVQK